MNGPFSVHSKLKATMFPVWHLTHFKNICYLSFPNVPSSPITIALADTGLSSFPQCDCPHNFPPLQACFSFWTNLCYSNVLSPLPDKWRAPWGRQGAAGVSFAAVNTNIIAHFSLSLYFKLCVVACIDIIKLPEFPILQARMCQCQGRQKQAAASLWDPESGLGRDDFCKALRTRNQEHRLPKQTT